MGRLSANRSNAPNAPRLRRVLFVAPLALPVTLALVACQEPLLSPRDERTPFDRYDKMRDQYAQQYVEDEFGRRQPNLRGRLAPKR